MSLWRQLTRGLRALTQSIGRRPGHRRRGAALPRAGHRCVSRADCLTEEALRAGATGARQRLTSVREQVRGYGWEKRDRSAVLADLRYAARRLRAAPGFTAITVLTLALGIGATTAIFSAVNPILFEPLPYPDAGRIAMILEVRSDGSRNDGTFGMYRGLAERTRSFDAIAVLKPWQPTMTGADQPERFDGQRVSASYFHVLGVPPVLGRDFQASDDRLNGPNVVILSDALWRRRFGGDRTIVGRQITLDDNSYRGHRRHAGRVRERAGSVGRAVGAAAVRHVAGAGVGSSPAHGGAAPARGQHRSGDARGRRARAVPC